MIETLWWHWAVLGFGLVLAELLLPAFVLVWFGAGGLLVALGMLLLPGMGLAAQLLLWTVTSVLMMVLWFKVFNMVACMGILRSGGDTRFVLVFDVGAIWVIGIPAAILAGLVFELPVAWVFAIILVEEFAKFFIWSWRIRSRRWLNSLVGDEPA
jgi:membrane protein implicated in regulation of membrane protease activity